MKAGPLQFSTSDIIEIPKPRSPFAPVSVNGSSPTGSPTLEAYQPDAILLKKANSAFENVLRPSKCRWKGCQVTLRSWSILEGHIHHVHCTTPTITPKATSAGTSSHGMKRFACQWLPCHGAVFASSHELRDHVTTSHLEHLRLTCPIKGCGRESSTLLWAIRHLQHHGTTFTDLPSATTLHPVTHLTKIPPLPHTSHSWMFLTPSAQPSAHAKFQIPSPSQSHDPILQVLPLFTWESWVEPQEKDMPEKYIGIGHQFNPDIPSALHLQPRHKSGTPLIGDAAQGVQLPDQWEEDRTATLKPTVGWAAWLEEHHQQRDSPLRPANLGVKRARLK